jgi:hypothetical protein
MQLQLKELQHKVDTGTWLHLSTSLQLRPHPQRRFNSAALSTSASTLRLHLSTSLQLAAPLNVASTSTASSTSLQLRLHLSMLQLWLQRRFNLQEEALRQRTCTEPITRVSTTHAIKPTMLWPKLHGYEQNTGTSTRK